MRSSPAPLSSSGCPNAFGGRNRDALDPIIAREQVGNLLLAFLGLERAHAIDERAAGPGQLDRAIDQLALHLDERRDVGLGFQPRHVGMAADRAGRGAGRVEQHGVERLGLIFEHIGRDHFGVQRQAREVFTQSGQPGRGAVDCGDLAACLRQLRGLAPGRSAQIRNTLRR